MEDLESGGRLKHRRRSAMRRLTDSLWLRRGTPQPDELELEEDEAKDKDETRYVMDRQLNIACPDTHSRHSSNSVSEVDSCRTAAERQNVV